MKEILKLDHIQKYYGNSGNVTKAIQDIDRKSTRLNSSHANESRMPSSA